MGSDLAKLIERVESGRADVGPKASYDAYNGKGAWSEATSEERAEERRCFGLGLRALQHQESDRGR